MILKERVSQNAKHNGEIKMSSSTESDNISDFTIVFAMSNKPIAVKTVQIDQ